MPTVAIPRQATTSSPARQAIEHGRGFRKLVKWRTGCEGRISYLKHRYGRDMNRRDGRTGTVNPVRAPAEFAHNLVKIGALGGVPGPPTPAPAKKLIHSTLKTATFSGRSNLGAARFE